MMNWLRNKKASINEFFKSKEGYRRVLGLFFVALAGLLFTIGNCIVQYIYQENINIHLSSLEVIFIRSLIQGAIVVCLMGYDGVHPYGKNLKNLALFIPMGLAEVLEMLFLYLSLKFIPVGTATVILFTSPAFTVLLSVLFLKKGCGWLSTICGLVSFFGVVLIVKPELFISNAKHSHLTYHHLHHVIDPVNQSIPLLNVTKDGRSQHDMLSMPVVYLKGCMFALISAICISFFFVLIKLNSVKYDVKLTIFYPSVCGVLICPVIMVFMQQKVVTTELSAKYWCMLVAVCVLYFCAMMLMAKGLQIEDAGPAVLIRNCDIVYAFLLQYLLMHNIPSHMTLIGASIILVSSSLITLNRAWNIDNNCCCKKVCKNSNADTGEQADEEEMMPLVKDGKTESTN